MAEHTEYQRTKRRAGNKHHKHSYLKKFACQLTVSAVIFALICSPILPESFKTSFKKALTYNIDTTYFSGLIGQALKKVPFDTNKEKEDVLNENTKPTTKFL